MFFQQRFIELVIFCLFIAQGEVTGIHFKRDSSGICEQLSKKCDVEEEFRLGNLVEERIKHKLQDRVITLRNFLLTQLNYFSDFFSTAIRNSQSELDTMFVNTYGTFYKGNVEVFNEFYSRIRSFSSTYSEAGMKSIVNVFFQQLFRVMFQLTNPFYLLTNEKWNCMENYLEEFPAFDDVPQRVINQLTLSFTNWRHFLAAIETTHNIFNGYLNITLKEECKRALTKMDVCSQCQGLIKKPCSNYCYNVLSGCTYQMFESEKVWNSTAETIIKLANQLNNHQNIISSLQPIPVLISEAIMNYQEKQDYITNKMISKCLYMDNDILSRFKRSLKSSEAEDVLQWNKLKKANPYSMKTKTREHLLLNQMFQSFIGKMEELKDFFGTIPQALCGSENWGSDDREYCWNGTSIGEYRFSKVLSSKPFENPAFQRDDFLTFRGNYVEERMQFQWLQSRLSHVLSTKPYFEETPSPQSYLNTDDEDYNEDYYEGSAAEFTTSGAKIRLAIKKDPFEVIIESFPVTSSNRKNVLFLIFLLTFILKLS